MHIYYRRKFKHLFLLAVSLGNANFADSLQELRNKSYTIPDKKIIKIQKIKKEKVSKSDSNSLDFSFLEEESETKTRQLSSFNSTQWLPKTFQKSEKNSKETTQIQPSQITDLPRKLVLKQIYLLDRQRFLNPEVVLSQLQEIQRLYPNAWQSYEGLANYYWKLNQHQAAKRAFQNAFQVARPRPPEILRKKYLRFLQESKKSE